MNTWYINNCIKQDEQQEHKIHMLHTQSMCKFMFFLHPYVENLYIVSRILYILGMFSA